MTATAHGGRLSPDELHRRNYEQSELDSACTASRHGTVTAYKRHGCRCDLCRHAWSVYNKAYQVCFYRGGRRHVSPAPARAILGALWADGWPLPELARRARVETKTISELIHGRRVRITPAVARQVAALAEEIGGWPGPSKRASTTAARHGWKSRVESLHNSVDAPSNDFVDSIAIERALAGDRTVHLTSAEKTVAVQQLHATGHGVTDIAGRLHMSGTYVRRYLERALTDTTEEAC